MPSSAYASLPCLHLGAKELELRLDCVSIVDRFDSLLTQVIDMRGTGTAFL